MRRNKNNRNARPTDSQQKVLRDISRIPLAALRQAVAVAEHLNFRHAANVLGVSQSSVSTRIKSLEEELGILIFERRHHGVRLTDTGRWFINEITVGIEQLDHAINLAGAVSRCEVGQLRMGVCSPISGGFLAELRQHYQNALPGIKMVLAEGARSELVRQVIEGELDIALVIGQSDIPSCHTRMLWTESMIVTVSAMHPLAEHERGIKWSDLLDELFLFRSGGASLQAYQHVIRRFGERGLTPRIERRAVERDTLAQMVAEGEGVTLTCESATDARRTGVRYLKVLDEPEDVAFVGVWFPHNRNPALRTFLNIAFKSAPHVPTRINPGSSVAPLQNRDL